MVDTNTIYTKDNLDELYLEYYGRTKLSIPSIQRRELAFSYWGDATRITDRHRYFETDNKFNEFLSKIPRSLSLLRRHII